MLASIKELLTLCETLPMNFAIFFTFIVGTWMQFENKDTIISITTVSNWDHVFLVRPFRRHLFHCRTFSAQIVSAPIRCSLTVHLFRVRVKGFGLVLVKSTEYWCRKGPHRNGRVEKSWTLSSLTVLSRIELNYLSISPVCNKQP